MNRKIAVGTAVAVFGLMGLMIGGQRPNPSKEFYTRVAYYAQTSPNGKIPMAERQPNDWFYIQRAYPNKEIPVAARLKALAEARQQYRQHSTVQRSNVTWTPAGPTNIPGRITDLAVDPSQPATIYAASAAGGVFKSTDFGTSWTAIFDSAGVQSIGAIALDPTNPNILYVGTGEANGSGDSYEGTGVYKSVDGGANWTYIGLPNSFHIGRIVVDPLRPDSVYVAVAGKLFGTNPERGLYRTPDGGQTWEQLLYVSDSTACIDIAFHASTGTILAAMWERYRYPTTRMVGGPTSGLYRSADFGQTWAPAGNGLPPSSPTLGRIGVTIDPQSSSAYAILVDHPGDLIGVYWSPDLGLNWVQTNDQSLGSLTGGYGWYFGQIRVAPGNPSTVYVLGVPLYRTTDGGSTWTEVDAGIHVDHHALYVMPSNPDLVYDGCDGGVNYSGNGGTSWTTFHDMPNSQFYAVTIDEQNPQRLYGGTQDNGTMRTVTGQPDDWSRILGGDGFYSIVDYTDPSIIFAEYQWGWLYKSTNGGTNWSSATNGIDFNNDRHNWNTPVVMDPVYHNILYYGSNRLYKSEDGGDTWSPISGDLTNGPGPSNMTFGTITTIAVARTDSQVVYVGTDDANVRVTTNGGGNWQNISASLPNLWVTRVAVDPDNAAVAYVTFSGYQAGSYAAHIYRTTDFGATWTDIHGNLSDAPINDVIRDPHADSTLYIATDFGVFTTTDLGQTWTPLGTGMPIVPVHDLAFHTLTRTLVAGTHGRSMFKAQIPCPGIVDSDGDGFPDQCDNCPSVYNLDQADSNRNGIGDVCEGTPCDCPLQSDFDGNATVDAVDLSSLIDIVFFGGTDIQDPSCPTTRGNFNCDSATDAVDLSALVDFIFFGQAGPCDPCVSP